VIAMTEDELTERLMQAGFSDRSAAERAIQATIGAFTECLTPSESDAFARSFTGPLAERARKSGPYAEGQYAGAEDLYETVRRRENVPPGVAREHAQIVLGAVAERLDTELRARLVRTLPDDLGSLLRIREEGAPPLHLAPSHAEPLTTLASGRPGSRHPVSEAAPDRAQSHSVVKESNPHGETKLSSARGITQERLGDAIATGHPGPARPISEVHDARESARRTGSEAGPGDDETTP
jgi:uncharacterized protein (DUF2267 family)